MIRELNSQFISFSNSFVLYQQSTIYFQLLMYIISMYYACSVLLKLWVNHFLSTSMWSFYSFFLTMLLLKSWKDVLLTSHFPALMIMFQSFSLFFQHVSSSPWTHQYTWWIKHGAKQCRGTIQRGWHNEAEVRSVWRETNTECHMVPRWQSDINWNYPVAEWAKLTKWNCSRAFK